MTDLIERLMNLEPGARQEVAAEIRRLTAPLAAMERERDAWKAESMAWRKKADSPHLPNCCESGCQVGCPCDNDDEIEAARTATDAIVGNQSK